MLFSIAATHQFPDKINGKNHNYKNDGNIHYSGFTRMVIVVLPVTGTVPPIASVFPFDSVLIIFSFTIPVVLSRMIFPVLVLFILVVVSLPIIIALEIVVAFPVKSTTIVESVIADKV